MRSRDHFQLSFLEIHQSNCIMKPTSFFSHIHVRLYERTINMKEQTWLFGWTDENGGVFRFERGVHSVCSYFNRSGSEMKNWTAAQLNLEAQICRKTVGQEPRRPDGGPNFGFTVIVVMAAAAVTTTTVEQLELLGSLSPCRFMWIKTMAVRDCEFGPAGLTWCALFFPADKSQTPSS
jgi:hypothetical protein